MFYPQAPAPHIACVCSPLTLKSLGLPSGKHGASFPTSAIYPGPTGWGCVTHPSPKSLPRQETKPIVWLGRAGVHFQNRTVRPQGLEGVGGRRVPRGKSSITRRGWNGQWAGQNNQCPCHLTYFNVGYLGPGEAIGSTVSLCIPTLPLSHLQSYRVTCECVCISPRSQQAAESRRKFIAHSALPWAF